MKQPKPIPSLDFAVLAMLIVAVGIGLLALAYVAAGYAVHEHDPNVKRFLARLAWMALTLAMILLVLLVWLWARQLRARQAAASKPKSESPYVDAWALAGRRFTPSPQQGEAEEKELADLDEQKNRPDDEEKGDQGSQNK